MSTAWVEAWWVHGIPTKTRTRTTLLERQLKLTRAEVPWLIERRIAQLGRVPIDIILPGANTNMSNFDKTYIN